MEPAPIKCLIKNWITALKRSCCLLNKFLQKSTHPSNNPLQPFEQSQASFLLYLAILINLSAMKRQWLTATMVIAPITIACHKYPINQPEPPIVAMGLKVKDITEKNLPSPYYHFEYNDTGNITIAGVQAGLRIYDVEYNGNNIESMEDTVDPVNKVRLDYEYRNGDLFVVRVKDKNGVTFRHCIFSFSPSHQLQQMDWDVA